MLNSQYTPPTRNLTGLKTSQNPHAPSLLQFLKVNCSEAEGNTFSVVSVMGKPNSFKSRILTELYGVYETPRSTIAGSPITPINDFVLGIAKSYEDKSFICNIDLSQSRYLSQDDLKVLVDAMNLSDVILLIVQPEDLEHFSLHHIVEGILMRNSPQASTKSQRLIVIFRSSTSSPGLPDNQTAFRTKLEDEWKISSKFSGLSSTRLQDYVKVEFMSWSQIEDDTYSFKRKLQEVKRLMFPSESVVQSISPIISPGIAKPSSFYERNSIYTERPSVELSSRSYQKVNAKLDFSDSKYSAPYPLQMERTRSAGSDFSGIEYKTDEDFEDLRKRIYRDVLFELIELRHKVEHNCVLKDFGTEGRLLYDKAVRTFDDETRKFHFISELREKKKAFMAKIDNDLYELFQKQVQELRKDVREKIKRLFEAEKAKIARGHEKRMDTALNNELDKIIQDVHLHLFGLRVFLREENPRWDAESLIEEFKREINRAKKEFFESISETIMKDLSAETKHSLKHIVDSQFILTKRGFWEPIEKEFRNTVDQQEKVLRKLWQDDPLSTKFGIEHRVAAFARECSEYVLGNIREKTKDIGKLVANDYRQKMQHEWQSNKHEWLVHGPDFAYERAVEASEKIRQELIVFIQELKWEKISLDARNFSSIKETHMIGLPRPFLQEEESEYARRALTDEIGKFFNELRSGMNDDISSLKALKIRKEFIFWSLWILFLYLQIEYLGLSSLWFLLIFFGAWKIFEYTESVPQLRHRVEQTIDRNPTLHKIRYQIDTLLRKFQKGKSPQDSHTTSFHDQGDSAKKKTVKFSAPKGFFKKSN